MRHLGALLTTLLLLVPSLAAADDPGTASWDVNQTGVFHQFSFTNSSTNSVVTSLTAGPWTIKFDPADDTEGADTATVIVWMQTGAGATATQASPLNEDKCGGGVLTGAAGCTFIFEVPQGVIWVDVVTDTGDAGVTATVTIEKG